MKYLKKTLALSLVAALILTGCSAKNSEAPAESVQHETSEPTKVTSDETIVFKDSVGREVTVPKQIQKVAISGPLAQIMVFSLAPDEMVGIATPWSKAAEPYLSPEYYNLPELGQLYGGKGELNLETLLASGAQVVIDIGEPKGTIVEDLDGLSEQTGVPFVHITATLDNMGEAYRQLGLLLQMEDQAEVLADYCDSVYEKTKAISQDVQKVRLLYCLGDKGQNVIANGSYHAEVIDMLSDNVAALDNPVSKGTGNEVDMEQIVNWNPDVILFAPDSIYDSVGSDAAWKDISAISSGRYYKVPEGPYNWVGFPPSVQRYLGMMWMSELLYPEKANLNLYEETAKYYKLFYHSDLSEEQFQNLISDSMPK